MRAVRFPLLPLVLFLASVLWQAPLLLRPPGVYDEGLILVGAQRILLGELPYRDFWNTHAPGQIAVVALLFKALGQSMIVERAYDALVRAGIAVACFALARRMGAGAGAFVAWAGATLFLGCIVQYGYVTFPALLCALGGLLLLTGGTGDEAATHGTRRRAQFLAGLTGGAGVLFRHDLGTVAVASGLLFLWLDAAAGPPERPERPEPGDALRECAAASLRYLAAVAAVTVPVALFFIAAGTPWHRLREIFFDYPFRVYPAVRALPAPAGLLERIAVAVPAALILAGLVAGVRGARRPGPAGARARAMTALAALGALTFPLAYTRITLAHQITVVVPALAILAGLLAPAAGGGARRRSLALLGAGTALAAMLASPAARTVEDLRRIAGRHPSATSHGLERARWVPLRRPQVAAVKAIREMVPEGGPVYVGLGRHDKAFFNDALFSFLAGRRSGTYYHNLLPGLVTTERVQREILAELARRPGMPLVLYAGADEAAEANLSRIPSGVRLLDRAIRRDYEPVAWIPPYEIRRRKSSGAPAGESAYPPVP